MAELIDKKLALKNIASFAIGGDPQEEPMANVDHIGMSIEDLPTVTEAEIRAKAIDEFLQKLLIENYNYCTYQGSIPYYAIKETANRFKEGQ